MLWHLFSAFYVRKCIIERRYLPVTFKQSRSNLNSKTEMLRKKGQPVSVFLKSSPFFHSCLNKAFRNKNNENRKLDGIICEMRALPCFLSFSVHCDHRFKNHVCIEKYFHFACCEKNNHRISARKP